MAKEYFKAFHSYLESIEPLNDAERGRLFTALLEYSKTGATEKLSGNERYVFPTLKANIDRETEAYAEKAQKNRENGSKGGRPKNPKNPVGFLKSEKSQDKEEDKDKDKDKEEDKDKHNARGAFDVFWSSYPKKVGKEAARKSFKKVDVPVETLVAAVEMQKRSAQWKKDKGRYIPNPATWLNQGRWDDEVEVETVGRTEGNPEKVKYGNYV